MAQVLSPDEKNIRTIVEAVREAQKGHLLCFGEVTLVPGQSFTAVSHPNCSVGAVVILQPETVNAAAAAPVVPRATITAGGFVIQHANNAQADRTFGFIVIGGR